MISRKAFFSGLIISIPFWLLLYGAYRFGRHEEAKIVWYSQLMRHLGVTQSEALVELPLRCSNGKDLGKLQVDLNLRNGQWRIVRNDAGFEPDCTLPPRPTVLQPAPPPPPVNSAPNTPPPPK